MITMSKELAKCIIDSAGRSFDEGMLEMCPGYAALLCHAYYAYHEEMREHYSYLPWSEWLKISTPMESGS